MSRRLRFAAATVGAAALLAAGVGGYVASPPATPQCHVKGALPDPVCTPGDVLADVTAADICTPGYASRVRHVSESTKNAVLAEYGMSRTADGDLELDHLVSLELGGSNDPRNLWPESAPAYHDKDSAENFAHREVCAGRMSLADAQHTIATDWTQFHP